MEQLVKLPVRPAADSRNIIQGENYRITMLTEGLVRLEYSEDGILRIGLHRLSSTEIFPQWIIR